MRFRLAAAAALAAGPAVSQELDLPGGPLLTIGLSQSATLDTNFGLEDPRRGNSYFTDTRVSFGVLSETDVQSLGFGFDTGLRALWEADRDFRFTFASPSNANLDYGRDWAGGGVDIGLDYTQTEVDADTVDQNDDNNQTDAQDRLGVDATQYTYRGSLDLELAQDSPSSYTFSARASRIDYNRTSIDRSPRDTAQAEAGWRLRFNDTVSGAVNALYIYYSADNDAQTQVRFGSLDAGVIYEPSEVLRVDLGLGYSHRERREIRAPNSENPQRDTETDSGPAARFALRYAFQDVTVNGELRYTAAADGAPVTGQLRAAYPLPRGVLSGRIFQNKTGAASGSEARVSGVGISLDHSLNDLSSLAFDATAAYQVDETAPFEPDITRYSFSAVYSRELTETINASIGYTYRTFDQQPDYATGNIVFIEVGKSFSTQF